MTLRQKAFALGAGAAAVLGFATPVFAQATLNCTDATNLPNPVFVTGSSASENNLKVFAAQLAAMATPINIIYVKSASCDGVTKVISQGALTGTGSYYRWNPAAPTDRSMITKTSCTLNNEKTTLGASDVGIAACPPVDTATPVTTTDVGAWVQSMLLVVRKENTNVNAISAEQANAVYGCGNAGMVTPFTDMASRIQRDATSGTQRIIGAYISVDPDKFVARNAADKVTGSSGGDMGNTLIGTSVDPQKAIGFMATDTLLGTASFTTNLKPLAFKAFHQNKAYYADSAPMSPDKRNVRDGHYAFFGPEHFIALTDATSTPIDPNGKVTGAVLKNVMDWITGAKPIDATKPSLFIDTVADPVIGNIPQCAMKVKRAKDGDPIQPYTPAAPCGCYFEKVATGAAPASCVACSVGTPCAGGKSCNFGYCE